MVSPCSFAAWGMGVIGPIELAASNGHRFILVAIDYFTKWVEASTYKVVTKNVVADFIQNNIVCRFGIPKSIITENAANLNSYLMKEICEKFKIVHRNSTAYIPKMNGAVKSEALPVYTGAVGSEENLSPPGRSQKKVHTKLARSLRGPPSVVNWSSNFTEMDRRVNTKPINSDAIKIYYV
uniref:Uncharacterized protein K02A2.6-like n=1 Tax=Nicotiana sylvestris TaxID=4096 RepID=A0A1U7X212_NICSY|nr:PREDICTED: uncharacterized protein K02A2.6-like [Nicotiana sylvestris]